LDEILSLDQPPLGRVHPLLVRGHIAAARGDLETAEHTLQELRTLPAGVHAEAQYALSLARLEINFRLAAGDLAGAVAAARAFPRYNPEADARYPWALLVTAMRACAEARALSLPSGAGDPAELRDDLESRAARVARLSPLHDAYAALFAAEAARADGRADLAGWDAATAAWEEVGQPYPLAYALALAAGSATAGDGDAAASRLRRAAALAGQLCAQPLQHQISQLARRARIQLPSLDSGRATGGAPVPFGLTAREQEVLRLVAARRGHREMASRWFFSPPTPRAHVSQHPRTRARRSRA